MLRCSVKKKVDFTFGSACSRDSDHVEYVAGGDDVILFDWISPVSDHLGLSVGSVMSDKNLYSICMVSHGSNNNGRQMKVKHTHSSLVRTIKRSLPQTL